MAKSKSAVTNAMRILKAKKIDFKEIEYEADEVGSAFGEKIAELTGISPDISLKTLVAKGDKSGVIVACIPVKNEIDLKKLAKVSGNKKVEMIHVKELLELTGYIRGGVSPIGMKKQYPTYVEKTAENHSEIAVSGGKCGITLLMSPQDLRTVTRCEFADLISKTEE